MFDKLVNPNTSTITLKEVCDMIKARHDNAMRAVERLQQDPEFGLTPQIEDTVDQGTLAERQIQTYLLTKRQSIAVAARLNVGMLMVLVDYWIAREAKESSPVEAVALLQQELEKLQHERDQYKKQANYWEYKYNDAVEYGVEQD